MKNQITKKILDISELAKLTGMPASAIRYYDDNKLIRSLGRKGLKRLFDISTVEQLKFISLGQQAGFSLDEIKMMFQETGKYNVNRELVLEKADEISTTIKRLIATRKGLVHVAKCSAVNHFECPKFIRLLDLAGKKRTRTK
jgi:DNA-binding transcriptional MerR regulator